VGEPGFEHDLVHRLRRGDESAFVDLVERHHTQLIRLASAFVAEAQTAEDVAQETWLALLSGIHRFEERSSIRTWLFQVCVNRARSTGARDHRTIPVDLIERTAEAGQSTSHDASNSPTSPWPEIVAEAGRDADLVALVRRAITELPAMQQLVVTLRDVDGLGSAEVCAVMSISAANQRVLLHRGRAHIRRRLNRVAPAWEQPLTHQAGRC
jgi:RNA polymerase sigma-70 factor (ECF subfamily)